MEEKIKMHEIRATCRSLLISWGCVVCAPLCCKNLASVFWCFTKEGRVWRFAVRTHFFPHMSWLHARRTCYSTPTDSTTRSPPPHRQLHCFCSCFPLCKLWDCLSSSAPGPPRCCRGDCRENGVSGCALAGSENFWNNEKRGEMGKKDMWDAKEMSLCHTACSALVHVSSTFWSEECLGLSLALVMHCYRYALTLWTSPENNTGARNYKSLQLNTCTGPLSKIFLSYTQNNSW